MELDIYKTQIEGLEEELGRVREKIGKLSKSKRTLTLVYQEELKSELTRLKAEYE